MDVDYLKKVIAKSEEAQPETQKVSLRVEVPTIPEAEETKKDTSNMTMDELLANYEQDLGIEQGQDFEENSGAQIASEVNLLKQASE